MEDRIRPRAARREDRRQPQQVAATEPRPGPATILALQRAFGNHATTRFIQSREPRAGPTPRPAAAGRIQRYSDEQLKAASGSLKLPGTKVQAILEAGEATGLFREVYEVATSPFLLNPDGLATMLGSFKAIMPKTEPTPTSLPTQPSPQPTETSGGASGFLRELLYGLQHIRQELFVQFGAMAPDDLANALDRVNLKTEAEGVRTRSATVALGQHLGGDVVVWGGKRQSGMAAETVQHKVVEGKTDDAVANELRNAIHQLAGKNKELAIEGTQRTADIVVMPANSMANEEPSKLVDLIKRRLVEEFQGKALSTYVDVVRITTSACQVEYAAKTGQETIEQFETAAVSPINDLSDKTPAKWNAGAISRPPGAQAEPDTPSTPVAPEKAVAEMSIAELTLLIAQTENPPDTPFEAMNKSDLNGVKVKLVEVKTKWLATKTETLKKRRSDLNKQRESWVSQKLAELTPPAKSNEQKAWREGNQKDLRGRWGTDFAKDQEELVDTERRIEHIEDLIDHTGGDDSKVLTKFNAAIGRYSDRMKLLDSWGAAAQERNDYVKKKLQGATDKESLEKYQQEWATLNEENQKKAVLVENNQAHSKLNPESIARDNLLKEQKKEQRKKDEAHAGQVCQPLIDAVGVVKAGAVKDLMDSLIAVLQQARHTEGVRAICKEVAQELASAHGLADKGALERPGLVKFTENLAKRKDYNNFQGDLAELTHAVRMARQPAEGRSGPVVMGSTALDPPDKSVKQPQEVDVSFESPGKDVLDLHEVAWDLKTLENKLLGPDKQSQREGYRRVIQAQNGNGTGRKVRMTYVVHKTAPDDQQAIGGNVAPSAEKLGADVTTEVKPGDQGAMAKILSGRGYFLILGGKLFTPDEIAGWIPKEKKS